jgi:hypothetical protein
MEADSRLMAMWQSVGEAHGRQSMGSTDDGYEFDECRSQRSTVHSRAERQTRRVIEPRSGQSNVSRFTENATWRYLPNASAAIDERFTLSNRLGC